MTNIVWTQIEKQLLDVVESLLSRQETLRVCFTWVQSMLLPGKQGFLLTSPIKHELV